MVNPNVKDFTCAPFENIRQEVATTEVAECLWPVKPPINSHSQMFVPLNSKHEMWLKKVKHTVGCLCPSSHKVTL